MAAAADPRASLDRVVVGAALVLGAVVTALLTTEASPTAYAAGAAGLMALHERLRSEYRPAVAAATTLIIFAGTSLLWSMTAPTTFPDAVSFAAGSALLFLASRLRWGVPIVWILVAATPWIVKRVTGDTAGSGDLFSSTQGLLSLTPVAYLALFGSLLCIKRNPVDVAASFAILSIWVVGASTMLPGGTSAAFAHGLSAALALFAPGLAALVDASRRHPLLAVGPLVAVFLANNYWLMVQYTIGTIPKDAPVSFAAMMRQQAEVHTAPPYVYPFAFPANLWFALRERLPIDRYELLAFEPRHPSVDLQLSRDADRFLLDGWDAPGPDEVGPVRWISESRATIALPLAVDPTKSLEIVVTTRARLEEPPVEVDLGLELNERDVGHFTVPASAPTEIRVSIPASAVGRIARAGYNRLTFVSKGIRRAPDASLTPSDPPPSRSGNRVWPVAIYRIRITPAS